MIKMAMESEKIQKYYCKCSNNFATGCNRLNMHEPNTLGKVDDLISALNFQNAQRQQS